MYICMCIVYVCTYVVTFIQIEYIWEFGPNYNLTVTKINKQLLLYCIRSYVILLNKTSLGYTYMCIYMCIYIIYISLSTVVLNSRDW